MSNLAKGVYSAADVKAVLHASNRKIRFRYEILDRTGALKGRASSVLGGSVSYHALDEIKRTARFSIVDNGEIDVLNDRIKPYALLWMPPMSELQQTNAFLSPWQVTTTGEVSPVLTSSGGWVEFPMGVFLLSTTPHKADANGVTPRDADGYDLSLILRDDKVLDRYAVTQGSNYIAKVKELLDSVGMTVQNLITTTKTLPTTKEWAPGTPKLAIINDLLAAINYTPLWFDENGTPTATPYVSPAQRPTDYEYVDDELSVTLPEIEQTLDTYNLPNTFVLMVSEAELTVMRSVYTNSNPNSPTSTVSRGRSITDVRTVEADSQATLDAMAQRVAFEASQVFESVRFATAIMPFHSHADVLHLKSEALGLDANYSETSWDMELSASATMNHEVRRIVNV